MSLKNDTELKDYNVFSDVHPTSMAMQSLMEKMDFIVISVTTIIKWLNS